jgi:hypothetical protein
MREPGFMAFSSHQTSVSMPFAIDSIGSNARGDCGVEGSSRAVLETACVERFRAFTLR